MSTPLEELTALVDALRAETTEQSITPERMGAILQRMIDVLPSVSDANSLKGWVAISSINELPTSPSPSQQALAYLLDTTLYVYVGSGGNTLEGKYRSAELKGTDGRDGQDGATGPQGPKGDNGVHLGDVVLVNNLKTGGEESALTAEMGKELGDAVFGGGTRTINYADLTWTTGKGVTNTGSVVDAANYAYSQPFALEAGDELTITFRGSSISLIAKYENGAYTPIVAIPIGTPTNVDHTTTHTIEDSGNYAACCFDGHFVMTVVGATRTKGLVGEMADLTPLYGVRAITENIHIQGGSLNLNTGLPTAPMNSRNSFVRYSYMAKFIRFDSSVDKITSIATETGEDLYIICFDKDMAYLGYVQNTYTLPNNTKYIKIALGHSTDQEVERVLQVSATYHAPHFEYVKNVGNGIEPYYFAYECQNVPIVGSDISGNTYDGDQTRRFDMGYVMLPPNYSADGDPVPLVLFFHGSGMFKWKGTNATGGAKWAPIYSDTAPYIDLLTFICKCGYAVADCCAMTDKYSLSGDYGLDFKCAPIGQSCYASLYNYIVDNFNIRKDGVYAFGKSAGGEPVLQLAYTRNIPLRAIANMNPALEIMGTFRLAGDKARTNWLLSQFGYVNPNCENNLSGSGDVAYVKANINNIKGYDPFVMGTDIDLPTLADAWYKYARLDNPQPDLQAIVDAHSKFQPVPMKIWASEDDANTPYLYMQMYKQMVDRGNGICILRTMPNDTGKHMCTDGSSAVRCDYQTKYGGVVNTTVAFAEMIDWFNRW